MLDRDSIVHILDRISYQDWDFRVEGTGSGSLYLQVCFYATSNATGELERQHGRKWLLSRHMTEGEIVSTALKAVLTAEEHEARERFMYKGVAVFGPHIDIDAMLEAATKTRRREPNPTGDS